jgi:hypothetical protein
MTQTCVGHRGAVEFARSILDAIYLQFGDNYVLEPCVQQDIRDIYTETYYALGLVLLYLLEGHDSARLDLAAARLEKWERLKTETPFNNFANCLTWVIAQRSGIEHTTLRGILRRLCEGQSKRYTDVYAAGCGNNIYIMQLVTDVVLTPLATGTSNEERELDFLFSELGRYCSPEGFYCDAPRAGSQPTRQFPLAYCTKFLFLLGISEVLTREEQFRSLFLAGMRAALPLMTREGGFSYFGRSDNTTFANALNIFNLRLAAQLDPNAVPNYRHLAELQLGVYTATPRAPGGWLEVNQFSGGDGSERDFAWSRDSYAFPTEYSVASAAYVLLSELYCPPRTHSTDAAALNLNTAMHSADLGIAKLSAGDTEVLIRTGSQPQVCDRRYLGPTILRHARGSQVLIGALPKTCSTDWIALSTDQDRLRRVIGLLRYRCCHGYEQFDACSAGFIPVVAQGSRLYFPSAATSVSTEKTAIHAEHPFIAVKMRGAHMALREAVDLLGKNLGSRGVSECPELILQVPILLRRDLVLAESGLLTLTDTLTGQLAGRSVQICVRRRRGVDVRVEGMILIRTLQGWASDEKVDLDIYEMRCVGNELRYNIAISAACTPQ